MIHKLSIALLFLLMGCSAEREAPPSSPVPDFLLGSFRDDYDIGYTISDSLFSMGTSTDVHIVMWDTVTQFFVGRNDSLNQYDPGLFTRIDWMKLDAMPPYTWAFCMSVYNATSLDSALAVAQPNRETPLTGCTGYPFSRMKPIQN